MIVFGLVSKEEVRTMRDDLIQDRLGLVPKRVVGRLVPVRCELEWFLELPFEVQRQAYGNLVASKSARCKLANTLDDE
jgi:hypothetical protein